MRPPVDTAERPFVLVWEVTQACDLACEHCRADAQTARHPDELTTAEGKELLDRAGDFSDDQLVVLSGGDPMKRPDLVELVEYGVDGGLSMTLTPSGTTELTGETVDDLADAGLRRMALSLDGSTADRHDAFRGEDGSFDATLRAARQARAAGLPLQINTSVCAGTVDDLPEIAERVEDLGAVLWSVFFLVPVGRGRVLDPISPDTAETVMDWLHDVREERSFGIKTTEAPHFRRVGIQRRRESDARGERGRGGEGGGGRGGGNGGRSGERGSGRSGGRGGGGEGKGGGGRDGGSGDGRDDGSGGGGSRRGGSKRRAGIVAGDGFAFVSHVGEIYPSGFLPKAAGNVREDDLVEVYRESDLFTALRDRDRLTGKCGACEFRNVCGGSRSRAYAHTGDPLASDPLCPYVPEGYDGPLPGDESVSETA